MTDSVITFALASLSVGAMAWALYRRRVAVTAATLPWFAVIGVAVAIGRSVPMSGLSAEFFRNPIVYLVVAALGAGLWVILGQFRGECHRTSRSFPVRLPPHNPEDR